MGTSCDGSFASDPLEMKITLEHGGNDLGASLPSDRMTTVFSTDHPKNFICHCYQEGEYPKV